MYFPIIIFQNNHNNPITRFLGWSNFQRIYGNDKSPFLPPGVHAPHCAWAGSRISEEEAPYSYTTDTALTRHSYNKQQIPGVSLANRANAITNDIGPLSKEVASYSYIHYHKYHYNPVV